MYNRCVLRFHSDNKYNHYVEFYVICQKVRIWIGRGENMVRKKTIACIFSVLLAIYLIVGDAVAYPVCAAESSSADDKARDIAAAVSELTSAGDYNEGRVIVLYDPKQVSDDSEELVGSGGLLSRAERISDISPESYVNISGESLYSSREELVGDSGETVHDRQLAMVIVEDEGKTTEELLTDLLAEPGVLLAEPDYITSVEADADIYELQDTDPVPGLSSVMDNEIFPADDIEEEYTELTDDSDAEDGTAVSTPDPVVAYTGDVTSYQWGMSDGTNCRSQDILPYADVFSMNSPNWNMTGESNVSGGVIAVIDTGVDYTHPDLCDVLYTFSSDEQESLGCGKYGLSTVQGSDPAEPMDGHGHGTHCAGVIGSSWNGCGTSGMIQGAKILAIRAISDSGVCYYADVLKALAFVKSAHDMGIDVRVVSNSYGVPVRDYAMRVITEELADSGIIAVFASGNNDEHLDASYYATDMVKDLPNVAVVNASVQNGDKSYYSNYGQGATHVFAPGSDILSTIPVAEKLSAKRTYLPELDESPVYCDPEWQNLDNGLDLSLYEYSYTAGKTLQDYFDVYLTKDFSADGDGRCLKFVLKQDSPSGKPLTVRFLLPVAVDAPASYVSAAIYSPASGFRSCLHIINEKNKKIDGNVVVPRAGWSISSVSGIRESGNKIAVANEGSFLPIYLDLARETGSLRAGDEFYIDDLAVGGTSYTSAQTAYAFMDGTSMAAPAAAALAMLYYDGLPADRENAGLVTARLKANVRQKEELAEYCSSGGVVSYGVREADPLPVICSAAVSGTSILVSGSYFGEGGTLELGDTELEIISWDNDTIRAACPAEMQSGVQRVTVANENGTTRGAFLFTAPANVTDTAVPLYETALPTIPQNVMMSSEHIMAVCGLRDVLYVLVGITSDDRDISYASAIVAYSILGKTWKRQEEIPSGGLAYPSMTAYRGRILINGITGTEDEGVLMSYDPTSKTWVRYDTLGSVASALINYKDRLLYFGGARLPEANSIREIDLEKKTVQTIATLGTAYMQNTVVPVGDMLYVYGGYTSGVSSISFKSADPNIICFRKNGTSFEEAPASSIYLSRFVADHLKNLEGTICGADGKGYLVGAYMSGKDVEAAGRNIEDGDTFLISDTMRNLGKRLSHDVIYEPRATVYKGILYAFGISSSDGTGSTYIGRATTVNSNYQTPIQDRSSVIFTDVPSRHAYETAIYWAADCGITKGYSGTTLFGMNDPCTRGHAVMFLWNYAGRPKPRTVSVSPFKDVPKTHVYYQAILWAYQKGITKGYSNGKFGINDPCTRGHIATFIWKFKGSPKPKSMVNPFRDSLTPAYRNAILWAAGQGITKGFSADKTFRDTATCTRGQTVTFLYRMWQLT